MGSDDARDHHGPIIQGIEYPSRKEGGVAEGDYFVLSISAVTPVYLLAGATLPQYTDGLKAKEQEERDARLSKLRPSIRNLLKGNPNVHHYTTFSTTDKLFAQHPIWQQAKIESERRLIFDEHVSELKQREMVRPSPTDIANLKHD